MDPKIQSSFIPKKPIATGSSIRVSSTVNLFFLLSVILFILTLSGGGFLYFYNQYQGKTIAAKDAQLEKTRKDFSDTLTKQLTRLDLRIETSKQILDKHIAVSSVFKLIEALTAKNVRFTKFDYVLKPDNSGSIALSGEGRSFNSISFQSDLFRNSSSIRGPLFSDVRLDDRGNVLFDVEATVEPAVLLYKSLFSSN